MKKLLVFVLLLSMLIFTGCGSPSDDDTGPDLTNTSPNNENTSALDLTSDPSYDDSYTQPDANDSTEREVMAELIEVEGVVLDINEQHIKLQEIITEQVGDNSEFSLSMIGPDNPTVNVYLSDDTVFEVVTIHGQGGEDNIERRPGSVLYIREDVTITVFGNYVDSEFIAQKIEIFQFVR